MPADDRLWLENCNRAEDGREPTIEPLQGNTPARTLNGCNGRVKEHFGLFGPLRGGRHAQLLRDYGLRQENRFQAE